MNSRLIRQLRPHLAALGICALAFGGVSCAGNRSIPAVSVAPATVNQTTSHPAAQPAAPQASAARPTAAPPRNDGANAAGPGGSGSGGGRVIALTAADFDATINRPGAVVLVDFAADWCGPCRQLAPTIDRIASQFSGQVLVARIDVDQDEALANRYGVELLPTLMYFKNGQAQRTSVGLTSEQAIAAELRSLLP